jgi:glycosyltransferase involved in cell wall biosynthesis
MRISAIINTLNEENNIADCLESLDWVDEIIVVDMDSEDLTKQIAYKYTENVYNFQRTGYVEPARNFAISKAKGDWLLIVDADERIGAKLAEKLKEIATAEGEINFARLPRKNIIFGNWMKHSRWWPDYNVRFFKRGMVEWQDEIHSIPITHGNGVNLDAEEDMAIIHHNYTSLAEYFDRMNRYTSIQAKELIKSDYQFHWPDMIKKPLGEFLSRFFAAAGYEDGLHGFVLAVLQGFSEFLVLLKVWEHQGFKPQRGLGFKKELARETASAQKEISYWLITLKLELAAKKTERLWLRLKRKLSR